MLELHQVACFMHDMNEYLLFFLSALGAFNGLLLAGYIVITGRNTVSSWFLSALLVMVSLRVGKSVLYFFHPELDKTILQIGLSACFLIGPMTYFYSHSVLFESKKLAPHHLQHIIALIALTTTFGFIFPYNSHSALWTDYVYRAVNLNWLLYLSYSWWLVVKKHDGFASLLTRKNMVLLSVNIGVASIWLAYFTSSFTSYITGALSFSFILYVTLLLLFVVKHKPEPEAYKSKKFDNSTVEVLSQKLVQTMAHNDYYCEPLLTMPQVAGKMGITNAQLSQLLNDNFNKSFNTYLNELRVEKAKALLASKQNLTVEVIAERCGYNSMSTFYSAFKKIVELTPAKYRQHYQ